MTPNTIKAQIALRGWNQRTLAKKLDCAENELSYMISGERIYPELRKKFAALFGMKATEMFDNEFEAVIGYRKTA